MTAPKPRRRSIRFAIVAAVCLLMGAVTTVGVAWWPRWDRDLIIPLVLQQMRSREATFEGHFEVAGRALKRSHVRGRHRETRWEAGWPLLALRSIQLSSLEMDPPAEPNTRGWTWVSWSEGLAVPYRHSLVCRIPLDPIWPGFALDTALYATAWYLLLFTPLPLYRAGRRRFRVSRGMCPACAYDLKGSPPGPCPECGTGGEAS